MNIHLRDKNNFNKFSINLYIFLLCLNISSRIISASTFKNFIFIEKSLWNSLLAKITMITCLGIFLLKQRYFKRKLIIMLILSLCAFMITTKSNNRGFLEIFLFILAYPKNIDTAKIAKWQSYTFIAVTSFVFSMYKLGFINGVTELRGELIRNSSGFSSANGFANIVFLSLITFMYYKQDKWSLKHSIIWSVIIIYIYMITNSRMSFIMELIILSIMTFRCFKNKIFKEIVYKLSKLSFIFNLTLCILATAFYVKGYFLEFLIKLNSILTYRLSYMSKYFIDPGVSLFGKEMVMVSKAQSLISDERWSGLDNSYMYMLIGWGIIGLLIFTLFMYMLGKYMKETNNYYGALYILIISFIGITENFLAIVYYNFSIILISQMINEVKRRKIVDE